MPELRSLCIEVGCADVRTYIQSGNLVFRAEDTAAHVEHVMEAVIQRRFGLAIPIVVRAVDEWTSYVKGNPFPEASEAEPHLVMLALSKDPPNQDAVERLRERAGHDRIRQVGDVLWIHYAAGVARSKLSPGLLDRFVGSPVTTRNWRTVLKVEGLARGLQVGSGS